MTVVRIGNRCGLLDVAAPTEGPRPHPPHVLTRYCGWYYGWYANRVRGQRRAGTSEGTAVAIAVAPRERVPLREAQRWHAPTGD